MGAYDRFFEGKQVGDIDDTSLRRIDSYPTNTNLQFGTVVTIDSFNGSWGVEPWQPTNYVRGITCIDRSKVDGYYHTDTMASILTFGRIVVINNSTEEVDPGDLAVAGANGIITTIPVIPDPNTYLIGHFLTSALPGEKVLLEYIPYFQPF
jgi:hypothetical protein